MGTSTRREIAWIGENNPIIQLMFNYIMSGNISVSIKIHDSVTIEDFGDRKKLSTYCENTILANLIDTLHFRKS